MSQFYYDTPYHVPQAGDFLPPNGSSVVVHGYKNAWGGTPAGEKFRLARLPANAHIEQALVTSGVAAAFGLFRCDGVAIAADFIMAAARADALTVKIDKTIWQALGMAEDPKCEFDVIATLAEEAPSWELLVLTLWCVIPEPPALEDATREWARAFGPLPRC